MPLALSYQWGCNFNSLKNFQSCLTSRANTNVFLWSSNLLNITDSGQDSICLCSLGHCCIAANGDAESPSKGLPKDSSPTCLLLLGLICIPDGPLNCRRSPGSFDPLLFFRHCNHVFRFKIACCPHFHVLSVTFDLWSCISATPCSPLGWRKDQHPRLILSSQCSADLALPWTTKSSGGRQVTASVALVGVVCIAPVIPKQGSLWILHSQEWHWLSGIQTFRWETQRWWMATW